MQFLHAEFFVHSELNAIRVLLRARPTNSVPLKLCGKQFSVLMVLFLFLLGVQQSPPTEPIQPAEHASRRKSTRSAWSYTRAWLWTLISATDDKPGHCIRYKKRRHLFIQFRQAKAGKTSFRFRSFLALPRTKAENWNFMLNNILFLFWFCSFRIPAGKIVLWHANVRRTRNRGRTI